MSTCSSSSSLIFCASSSFPLFLFSSLSFACDFAFSLFSFCCSKYLLSSSAAGAAARSSCARSGSCSAYLSVPSPISGSWSDGEAVKALMVPLLPPFALFLSFSNILSSLCLIACFSFLLVFLASEGDLEGDPLCLCLGLGMTYFLEPELVAGAGRFARPVPVR